MINKLKKFSCVEMKHKAQAKISRLLEKMSAKEQLRFWQQGTDEFKKHQDLLRHKMLIKKAC